jgi:hypothetical protein
MLPLSIKSHSRNLVEKIHSNSFFGCFEDHKLWRRHCPGRRCKDFEILLRRENPSPGVALLFTLWSGFSGLSHPQATSSGFPDPLHCFVLNLTYLNIGTPPSTAENELQRLDVAPAEGEQ